MRHEKQCRSLYLALSLFIDTQNTRVKVLHDFDIHLFENGTINPTTSILGSKISITFGICKADWRRKAQAYWY